MNEEHLKLLKVLTELKNTRSPEFWYDSLSPRKVAELEFHNKERDYTLIQGETLPQNSANKKYYDTTEKSRSYVKNWLGDNVNGKVFLDYACGDGGGAISAAQAGAGLSIGLDISDVSVANAEKRADELGLKNCFFIQGDCENTGLPDSCIDMIICSGMLHHLDLNHAYPELCRILKPGGLILAKEALNYNPIIKLYRVFTPDLRTKWEKEHILSLKDVQLASKFFAVEEVRYWHITSYFAAFLKPFPALMKPALFILNALDDILTRIPVIQLLAWQFTFLLSKKESASNIPFNFENLNYKDEFSGVVNN